MANTKGLLTLTASGKISSVSELVFSFSADLVSAVRDFASSAGGDGSLGLAGEMGDCN